MCEQCEAKTVYFTNHPDDRFLGLYALHRATRNGDLMEKDDWGLIVTNDPTFIFKMTPRPCPFASLTEKELDCLPEQDHEVLLKWMQDGQDFRDQMWENARLVSVFSDISNIAHYSWTHDGWDPEKAHNEDTCFVNQTLERWLFHHLGVYMMTHTVPLNVADYEDKKEE